MRVVVNATPLIALSLINRLTLLKQLFNEVIVPSAVYEEVALQGIGRPGATVFQNSSWIEVLTPKVSSTIEPLLLGLDMGELQVLLLAMEVQPDWVLIDERLARRVAKAMGLTVKGTVGVLLAAFRAGFLSNLEALEAVHQLREEGIRISPAVVTWFQNELDRM